MAIKDTFEDRRARGSSGNLAWSMPAGWCIVFDPTNARRGDWALHWEGSSDPAPAYLKEELSVGPGERVQAFGFAKRVTGSNAAGRIQVSWRDAAGAEISVSDGSSVTAGSYGQSRLLEEAPAGSVSARLLADVDGTSGNAHEIFFDDVLIQVVTQGSDVNWSGIIDDGGKPQDFADVTGDTLLAGLLPNWSLSIADSSGLPAGIQPVQGIADRSQLSFIDSSNLGMRILSAPDLTVAYGWPAIPIDDRAVYTVSIRHRSETTSAEGYYLRLSEIAGPLADGETHVTGSNRTSFVDLLGNGPAPGTAYITSTYTYTPTPGTDFASFCVYNWKEYTSWVDVKWVSISIRASAEYNATRNQLFRQTSAPSGTNGDIWHDTDDDLLYRHNGSAWQLIANGFDDTSQLTDGASLGDTAIWASISGSGKAEDNATRNQLFRQTSAPTASSTGDLWYDTDDELLYRWDGSSWVVYAPSGGESATTVTDSDSGTTSATATINRGGAQTQINVALTIAGSAFSGGDPFPVAIILRRGGPTGSTLKQFTNIVGRFEEGFGGDPDFVICNFEGTFIDTNTGTGSTDYYVSGPNTAYNETLEITATQTYFS